MEVFFSTKINPQELSIPIQEVFKIMGPSSAWGGTNDLILPKLLLPT